MSTQGFDSPEQYSIYKNTHIKLFWDIVCSNSKLRELHDNCVYAFHEVNDLYLLLNQLSANKNAEIIHYDNIYTKFIELSKSLERLNLLIDHLYINMEQLVNNLENKKNIDIELIGREVINPKFTELDLNVLFNRIKKSIRLLNVSLDLEIQVDIKIQGELAFIKFHNIELSEIISSMFKFSKDSLMEIYTQIGDKVMHIVPERNNFKFNILIPEDSIDQSISMVEIAQIIKLNSDNVCIDYQKY